jgi:hypothetical protein
MATSKTQAVAPVNADGQLPVGYDLQDIMEDAGVGSADMGAGDLGIPYLSLLQPGSPQLKPGHAKYIEGARVGEWFNSATGETFSGAIDFIPCAYERKYVQWHDRDLGEGGYVMDHSIDSDIMTKTVKNAKGQPSLPDQGHDLIIETAYQYGMMHNPNSGRWDQVVMPLKSTALKANRRMNNLIAGATIPGTQMQAPRWLYSYSLSTVLESKGQNSWYTPVPEKNPEPVSAEAYRAGKKFNALFQAGAVSRANEGDLADGGTAAAAPAGERATGADDDVPY